SFKTHAVALENFHYSLPKLSNEGITPDLLKRLTDRQLLSSRPRLQAPPKWSFNRHQNIGACASSSLNENAMAYGATMISRTARILAARRALEQKKKFPLILD